MRFLPCFVTMLMCLVGTVAYGDVETEPEVIAVHFVEDSYDTLLMKKLSPELYAVQLTGGVLLGYTEDGAVVIQQSQVGLAAVVSDPLVTAIDKGKPDVVEVVERIIVSYDKNKRIDQQQLEKAGFTIIEEVEHADNSGFYVVTANTTINTAAVNNLAGLEGLAYAGPDYIVGIIEPLELGEPVVSAAADTGRIPNDTFFEDLWGMKNINAPTAWKRIIDSPEIIVAVIDSGVDYDHPDLQPNMWTNPGETPGNNIDDDGNGLRDDVFGADYYNGDGNPYDDNAHGTHCAGTIGAVGNNGVGVVGVTWKTKIMALKFLGRNGQGPISAAIKCVRYAIDKKAHVLSNSWGGGGFSFEMSRAIDDAEAAGMLFVAAAGNSGTNNDNRSFYPANYEQDSVISVLRINPDGTRHSTSSFGVTTVDIGAPGSDILSSVPTDLYSPPHYRRFSGTSMACPHVSGACALIWASQGAGATWKGVRNALYENGRDAAHLECSQRKTLDIAFLADSSPTDPGPDPVPVDCCSFAVSNSFSRSDAQTPDADGNLLSVKFNLGGKADLHVFGNATLQTDAELSHVTMGFKSTTGGELWPASRRTFSLRAKESRNVTILSPDLDIPAGDKTIYWHVETDAGTLTFDAGALLVQGFYEAVAKPSPAAQKRPQMQQKSKQASTAEGSDKKAGKRTAQSSKVESAKGGKVKH